ncbi:uncharacterized protein LOC134760887 isoform X5 [Pongo abelii]|uniref:uncharacterized protein LOC134760887 isoform X5 n=1 Tax=Pongo abelii TaxID=9601 RepID=UPI00300467E0
MESRTFLEEEQGGVVAKRCGSRWGGAVGKSWRRGSQAGVRLACENGGGGASAELEERAESEMCLLLPGDARGSRNAGDEGCFGLSIHLSTPNWTPPATAGAC